MNGAGGEARHDALLAFLRTPAAHAEGGRVPACVEAIETHMAWVFVAGQHAMKLKKPVRYPSLDYSTAVAREAACREEVRLNRRLAPDVYEGVTAVQWHNGRFVLVADPIPGSATEPAVDWLVRMRRLPRERMLDRAIVERRAGSADIDALIDLLVAFYRDARRVDLEPGEYLERLRREQAVSREVLLRPQFQLDGAAAVLDRLDDALLRSRELLQERAARRRIVDGHGDLRPEHICLLNPPVIIDALEFNPLLRHVDPFDELAFLGLECDRLGAGWIGPRLVERCAAALGDPPPPTLQPLYTAWRALLRARLAMAHLLDTQPRTPLRWAPLAQQYVALGARALGAFDSVSAATRRGSA
jgi:aminoglycoside phosphotransferase family enzyme